MKRVVGEGHLHDFGTGSFTRPNITGVTFQTPPVESFLPSDIVPVGVPYLLLLTLFEDEVKLAKSCGTTRLNTLLGLLNFM